MTAAALRPDLITHLFATQRPPHEKSDAAATALSIALHGAVVVILVWGSASIKPTETAVVEEVTNVIPYVRTVPERKGGEDNRGGRVGTQAGAPPQPIEGPHVDVRPNPAVAFDPTKDFARPGTPSPTPDVTAGSGGSGDALTREGFEIRSVAPALLNQDDVKRALERNYPAMLRDAGISGRVTLWLLLDETGRVTRADVKESSGHAAFDDAARRVGEMMRFSPAMNRDARVKVWVALPIVFTTR
jgi:TonB family protein